MKLKLSPWDCESIPYTLKSGENNTFTMLEQIREKDGLGYTDSHSRDLAPHPHWDKQTILTSNQPLLGYRFTTVYRAVEWVPLSTIIIPTLAIIQFRKSIRTYINSAEHKRLWPHLIQYSPGIVLPVLSFKNGEHQQRMLNTLNEWMVCPLADQNEAMLLMSDP